MMFYQCWTVGQASVFGVFVACISKGRKLWELALYSFVAPLLTMVLWASLWGGTAMRQARQAMELEKLGEAHYNNSAHFLVDGSDLCYDVPQNDLMFGDTTVFTNRLLGVTPVCKFDASRPDLATVHVLESFRFPGTFGGQGLGLALTLLYLMGCTVFYVAFSDSASFMVDIYASNGRKNTHWARRLLWASSAGALTTALLSLGGSAASKPIESAIIIVAIPFAFLMCFLLQTITLFCQAVVDNPEDTYENGYQFPDQPEFAMPVYGGIFNVIEFGASFGKVNMARVEMGIHQPTRFQMVEFVKGLLIPFVSLRQILQSTYPENPKTNATVVICYALLYISGMTTLLASRIYPGLAGFATTFCILAGGSLGLIRAGFRSRYNLRSNHLADLLTGLFLWPQVLVQMRLHCVVGASKPKEKGVNDKAGAKRGHRTEEFDGDTKEFDNVCVDDGDEHAC
jgi:BCCT, betaine/carnitine/choline family transporter